MTETEHIDLSKLKIHKRENPSSDEPSRSRMGILLYALGFIVVVGSLFFFSRSFFASQVVVEVTTVSLISPAQASALLTASGYVVAQRKAAIASKATGRLMYLGFEEGDRVKKGEIIARIESADVEAALAQAKANLEVSKAERFDAEQSLIRAKKLLEGKLISQAEFDAAQARYDRVSATIAAADAGVHSAQVQYENTLIRAPFTGTILTKNADIGEVVAPFGAGASSRVAVVTMADMTSLEVEADVSESNIEKIKVHQPCEIVLDAYPEKRYPGSVNKIVPTADRSKATVLTKIRFTEIDERVLPEMSAKVHFISLGSESSMKSEPKLTVDAQAIAARDGKKVVFVLKSDEVAQTPIETGDAMGSLIEIKQGLVAGDKVVIRPSDELHNGTKVKLKQ